MKTDGDKFTLECTGKEHYANDGIIGLSPNGGTYTGYDDNLAAKQWTIEEQIELAEHMIQRWQTFKANAINLTPQDPLSGYSQTAWHEIPVSEISPEAFGFLGD